MGSYSVVEVDTGGPLPKVRILQTDVSRHIADAIALRWYAATAGEFNEVIAKALLEKDSSLYFGSKSIHIV